MLERTLEPEEMDDEADAREYDAMDHDEVNRAFVDDLLTSEEIAGEVLDVGTGTAQIPLELLRRRHDLRVIGVDLAPAMLDLGMANIVYEGFSDKIALQPCDAKCLPFDDERFDAVLSNSIVHHIPEPLEVLREAWRVLKPGGQLFFRDLMRPKDIVRLEGLVATHAQHATRRQRELFTASLHAALRLDEIRELVEEVGVAPETVTATSDRHWTWSATKP